MKTGIAFAVLLGSAALYQGVSYRANLERETLRRGRVVISTGDSAVFDASRNREGSARYLLDGQTSTCARLYFPSNHPEGTHFFAELALTHFPGKPPRLRRPRGIRIIHGCENAAHIGKAEVSVLLRRANDIDAENVIPAPVVVYSRTIDFSRGDEEWIPLPLDFPESNQYPDHVSVIIVKVRILSVREAYWHAVGIREVVYVDSDAQSGIDEVWTAQ